jgi:hypothetical protein
MRSSSLAPVSILIAAALLTGCFDLQSSSGRPAPESRILTPETSAPVREVAAAANPGRAIREIYIWNGDHISELVDVERLMEIIGITSFPAAEVYARYSDPRGGLADVVIIKPEEGGMIEVREALYLYRDRRVIEFEHFDVLGSLNIAQNAIIFEHGEYVVLLMTSDNDAALLIVNQFIPL